MDCPLLLHEGIRPGARAGDALDRRAKSEVRIVIVSLRGVCFTGCIMKNFARLIGPFTVALVCFLLGCSSSPSTEAGSQGSKALLSISSISPSSLPAGIAATLTVTGTGFTANTIVAVNGISLPTTYISASQVTAAIAAGQFATVATLNITVSDSGSTASNSTVTLAVENPLPTIAGINPPTAVVGSAATNVNVAGTGFMSGTVVRVNGAARSTTFTSAILATVSLSMEDLATVGSLAVTAFNPTPGGGTSSAATFSVVNPAPGAITVSPS